MILPKHTVEAHMELSSLSEITQKYEDRINNILSSGSFSCESDLSEYIKKLLVTVALLDGDVNELKKSALSMFGIEEIGIGQTHYLQTVPPRILYEAFIYQNLSGEVVLPELLSRIKTITLYIGQLGDIDKAEKFYNDLVSTYQHALEALQIYINSN